MTPVDVQTFVSAMERQIKTYEPRAVVSNALRSAWLQMVVTFNAQLTEPRPRWPVIPAELGAGKTTAVKVYCTLLQDDPGVLIVVRTKKQAEEYACDINAWSGRPIAFAHHSGLPLAERQNLDALAAYPVLVVCHKAYEQGLDEFAVDVSRLKFERMHQYKGGQRALVFIDEALDQVYEARIERGALKQLLAKMPRAVEKAHPEAMRVIESANRALREAPDDRHRTLEARELLAAVPEYTPEQADALLSTMWEQNIRGSNRIEPELRVQIGEALTALRRLLGAYRWISGNGAATALSGNRLLLLPPGTHGVILDATGHLNNVYLGRPEEFEVRYMLPVRDYSAVTIFDARTSRTGKWAADERLAKETIEAVLAHYGDRAHERRVLAVVAERGEEHFRAAGAAAGFAAFDVAHWNDVDGRNDWREFDTLVIATINYGTHSLDLNTYMAVSGRELDDEALNELPDEVRTIRENRIAAQLAQAMGRIRLRTMTQEDGTCEPCDIFLRLTNWPLLIDPDRILDAIRRTLPGVRVERWDAQTREPRPVGRVARARGRLADQLVALARALGPGERRELTMQSLRATNGSLHRVLVEAQTPGSALFETLAREGAYITPGRRGRGGRAATLGRITPNGTATSSPSIGDSGSRSGDEQSGSNSGDG